MTRATRFSLAPGQIATVEGTGIRVEFVTVLGDSRCPADVVCVQMGEAIVQLRVNDNGLFSSYEVRTGAPERASVMHRDLRIELIDLQPYPFTARRIDPFDYRATLTTR